MAPYDALEVTMFFFLRLFLIPNDISPGVKEQLLLNIQKAIHSVEGLEDLEVGIALVADQIPYELGSEIIGRGEFCGFKPSYTQFDRACRGVFHCLRRFVDNHVNTSERLVEPGLVRCRIVNLRIKIDDYDGSGSTWYAHDRND